jgi:Cu/Ag efflux pump CusA
MRSIVAWSLQLRLLAVVAAAVLIFFGITELRQIPLDVVPEFSRPHVEVQTEALGLSAEEVEAMITVPLEADMLNGVSWVDEIRSESIPGLSSIVMFFEPGTDLLVARQMVSERLVGVHALPNVSTPPAMLQPLSSTSRFMQVGLSSDTHSLIDMSVLARWTIIPRLRGVPGVANVSLWGQRRRQLQVQVDPERLRDEGITLNQVIKTAGNALWVSPLSFLDASSPGTGGWVETPNQRLGVRHESPIDQPEDLAQVIVDGTRTRLGEVTTVVEDHQPLIGDARVDEAPALMLVIEKFPWANTVEATQGVEEALASLKLGLPGVEMDSTLFRPATYLELARGNLRSAAVLGAALVVVALLGLLFSWRTALISTLAVLLSAIVAVGVLYVMEVPINLMIIAGLVVALGAMIDDAIIDIQNIGTRLRTGRQQGKSAALAVFEAALEMRGPIVYATLIVLLAVVPVLFLEGVVGVFSQAVVLAYVFALLASMLVALTITPALSLLLLGDDGSDERESPLVGALRGAFEGLIARAAQVPGTGLVVTVSAVGVAVVFGLAMAAPDQESAIPQFRERDILVDIEGAAGAGGRGMGRIVDLASNELLGIPGVRNVSAHIGRAVMSDRVADVDEGEIWVSIDPSADYDATLAAVREAMAGYPGLDIDVDTYLADRIGDESGFGDELVVRVYGERMETIQAKAEEVAKAASRVDGVVSARVEHPIDHPNVEIEVDLERAKAYGLKPGDVRRAATTLISGIRVGDLFEEQKVFDVVVWGTPEIRRNLSDLGNLLIDTPPPWAPPLSDAPRVGGHVRLSEVADVRVAPATKVISREAVARHIDVMVASEGRELADLTADIEESVRASVDFPLEYRTEVLGGAAQALATQRRTLGFAVGAALGILLLLQAAFGSWRLAASLFLALPAAVLGGLLVGLAGGPMSLGTVLGLLAVYGLATRNALTLVRRCRDLERETGEGPTTELVRRATSERFAPIVMTAVVTALAFLPFALFGTVAGNEILHPMALVVLGGLVSATLVTLLVVPALYLRFGADAEPDVLVEEEPPRMIA